MDAPGHADLPILGKPIARMIDDLVSETSKSGQADRIEEISGLLITELRREGLSDSLSDYLLEHAFSVHSRILDEELRERFWVAA